MAQKVNLVIDQGTTFATSFTLNDEDGFPLVLNAHSGSSQMRKHFSSNNFYSFTVSTDANGNVQLAMNAATTNSIPAGRYVYDVELTDPSFNVSRVIEGIVIVTPGVTR